MYSAGHYRERIMKRFAFASLVIITLLFAGCAVPVTNTTHPGQTGTAVPGNTSQPPTTTIPAMSVNQTVANSPTNGTGSGNVTISSSANDLFLTAPLNGRYYEGDIITLHGTTILAAGDPLLVEVVSSSFGPTVKTSNQAFTGVSGVVHVEQGPPGGPNTWSFSFPTAGFNPDTYIVTVLGLSVNVEDSTTFELLPGRT